MKIKGFSYWRRSQKKFNLPEVEFEEQMENANEYRNALTIARHLQKEFHKIENSYKKSQNVPKVKIYHHCLRIKKLKRPHRHRHKVKSGKEEIVINISSYGNISSCITGKRWEQVYLDADSDTENVNVGVKSQGDSSEYVEYDETEIKQENEDIEYISSDSEIGGDEVIPPPPPSICFQDSPSATDFQLNQDPNYLMLTTDPNIQYEFVFQRYGKEVSVMIDKNMVKKDFVDISKREGGEIPVSVLIKCCALNCKAKPKPKNFLKHLRKAHKKELVFMKNHSKNWAIVWANWLNNVQKLKEEKICLDPDSEPFQQYHQKRDAGVGRSAAHTKNDPK